LAVLRLEMTAHIKKSQQGLLQQASVTIRSTRKGASLWVGKEELIKKAGGARLREGNMFKSQAIFHVHFGGFQERGERGEGRKGFPGQKGKRSIESYLRGPASLNPRGAFLRHLARKRSFQV